MLERIFWLGILLFLITGCYENKVDCLDVRASDFAIDADEPCSDCCEFPVLRLQFQHKVQINDSTIYNLTYADSVYYDGAGNPFRINNIQYYISEAHLFRVNGAEEETQDSIELEIFLDGNRTILKYFEDNFNIVNPGSFQGSEAGTFAKSGVYNRIRLAIGLAGDANKVIPTLAPEGHPLADLDMYTNPDSGYIFNSLELFRDTTAADTIPYMLNILTPENLVYVDLDFPEIFFLANGAEARVTIRVNYLKWFEGVNIKGDREEMIRNIVDSIAHSFSVIEVL